MASNHDASRAQYGPTATPTPTIGPPHPSALHALPVTGYAVAWPLAIGVVLVALGMLVRGWRRGA